MHILTLRTDQPQAEIGLFNDEQQISYESWIAFRQLAETIHIKIKASLDVQKLELKNLGGIVVYQGPGSFTGLRIGIAVVNALAASLEVAIVGTTGDDWVKQGLRRLLNGEDSVIIIPEYGALPNITAPRK